MPRWGPDADNRLYLSAMELIFERGYDAVTVAEIAEHAGLKKRSFFRHFADKREVMFAGAADFEKAVVDAVRAAPRAVRPVDAVMTALADAGAGLTKWGEPVRQRQRVVATSIELRERELIKFDSLASAVAEALGEREVDDLTAILVAKAGVAALATAFQQWVDAGGPADFPELMAEAHRRLRAALCDGP
ncbi:TetR/AcrR family transcriptional regulator [Umezawaea tangerina]|uniref:TetR family transcriptional regulator n=1 Tax=Umezawaea tangerina TaxID=84725 RepID=A0A2T0TH05_9PSEU|nr:TetR/AcrR family transcriptional regulator [Umezawaea tangerina]PRY44898.1 TetR family transcriptional regulator [Umezawaea tangerina]